MTQEQKNTLLETLEGEKQAAFVDITDDQLDILMEYDLFADRNMICAEAFNQALKNKLRATMNQAVLAKDKAFRKGQSKVVEALEVEYQKANRFLSKL